MNKYDDVRVIKTGEIGMVVNTKDGKYLVDFNNHLEWYDESDLLLAEQED